ncbi:MAG: glycoside hydrolase family 25 [Oscillospiraceae bacterium]|nr:glycoside hydrolase family 25 [Oscillospiraceae bacterium]MCR5306001.1 glycoside hydrolase family 25 [Oscillospiraceae bacterium]
MKQNKKGLHRLLRAWAILTLLILAVFLMGWKGLLWFNMPSKSRYPVRGVDVSHYQGEIDWAKIASQDMHFAFIKATEGSASTDEYFAANWKGARAAGLKAGAYHFFSFDSAAETQADNFIAAVPAEPDALPPVIDLEYYRKGEHPPADTVRKSLSVLLSRFEAAYGKKPIIYTSITCYENYLKDSGLDYTLWIRSVYSRPSDNYQPAWTFWQYNPCGRLEGYNGTEDRIDLNAYCGSLADFEREFN